jgi:zinc protease
VIATRLADDAARGDAEFLGASVDSNSHVRPLDAPSVLVDAEAADVEAALDALLVEFERVRRYGFAEAEVSRAVDRARSASDAAFDARDTVQDVDYAARYVDHFLTGTAIADADDTHEFEQALLDSVTPDLLSERFVERWAATAPHVLVVGPADADLPESADVIDAVTGLADRDLDDRVDSGESRSALMAAPEPVKELSIEELVDEPGVFLDATMLEFPNGARLIVNPTDIVDGRVSLSGRSPGGLALVADADVTAAQVAGQVVGMSGLGELDVVATEQVLAGVDAYLEAGLTTYEEQVFGDAASSDLEVLFQLLHLSLASPNIDDVAVDRAVTETELLLAEVANDQELAVQVELTAQVYGDEPRLQVLPDEALLAAVDASTVERVWGERFGDAGDWVFSLAGDVDLGEVLDLARRYIGTLPGAPRTEEPANLTPDPPPGVVRSQVEAGTGDRGQVVVFTAGPARELTLEERVHADVVTGLVTNRLTDLVREELGESYSPFSVTFPTVDLVPRIESYVFATGAPDRLGEIARLVQTVAAPLRAGEVSETELTAALENVGNEYELFSNEQLNEVLLASVLDDRPADELVRRTFVLDEVDAASVASFTTEHLPIDRYVEVTAIPA